MGKRGSLRAQKVAKEVIENLEAGGKKTLRQIQIDNGYSATSVHSNKVLETRDYKIIIADHVKSLEHERDRTLAAMAGKDLTQESYKVLTEAYDKINKNIQLHSGKPTSITGHSLKKYKTSELRQIIIEEEGVEAS